MPSVGILSAHTDEHSKINEISDRAVHDFDNQERIAKSIPGVILGEREHGQEIGE